MLSEQKSSCDVMIDEKNKLINDLQQVCVIVDKIVINKGDVSGKSYLQNIIITSRFSSYDFSTIVNWRHNFFII